MLTEISLTRFVVKVNGITVCAPQLSRQLAEAAVLTLTPEQQALAVIVPITDGNQELLLG